MSDSADHGPSIAAAMQLFDRYVDDERRDEMLADLAVREPAVHAQLVRLLAADADAHRDRFLDATALHDARGEPAVGERAAARRQRRALAQQELLDVRPHGRALDAEHAQAAAELDELAQRSSVDHESARRPADFEHVVAHTRPSSHESSAPAAAPGEVLQLTEFRPDMPDMSEIRVGDVIELDGRWYALQNP